MYSFSRVPIKSLTNQVSQENFILSQIWELDVQNQVSAGLESFRSSGLKSILSLPPWFRWLSAALPFLSHRCLSPHFPMLSSCHVVCSPVCPSVPVFPLFYKDINHIGFRTQPNPVLSHINLITTTKTIFPNSIIFTDSRWWLILERYESAQ